MVKRVIKQLGYKTLSLMVVAVTIFAGFGFVLTSRTEAATSGQMKMYLHKSNSDANEAYNSMGITPAEPSSDTSPGSTITLVQHTSTTGSSAAPSVNFGSTPTQNNLLVAYVFSEAATAITMTSSGWTTGTSAATGTGSSARAGRMFWKIAGAGESSTVTAASASAGWTIAVAEYSGIDTTTPLDGTVAGTGENAKTNTSGTNTTSSITPNSGTRALVVGALAVRSASRTYSSEAFSGRDTSTVTQVENPNSTNGSSDLFSTVVGSTFGAYQGSATPSANAVGTASIAIFRAANSVSSTNVGATPPTSFCESSANTTDNANAIAVNSTATGNRCVATFISQPLVGSAGGTIALNTGDAASVTGQFWSTESTTGVTAALNAYIYRWNSSGTSVNASDRIATLTCADPTASIVSCTPAAVAPANNVTFNAGDRLVVIMSLNITVAAASTTTSAYFDSTGRAGAYVKMGYTTYGYNSSNKPALSGSLDEDFTTDTATTACSTTDNTTHYNSKWTCLQGSAANTAGNINAASVSSPTGDSTGWLWLQNQTTATSATISNFGTTPSNTFLYQTLPGDYGNGNVTTVINSSALYDVDIAPATSASPYSHSGLVMWTSNTDYLEIQVYADGAINDSGTNDVHVALNNSGSLSGAVNLNSATTGNTFSTVWVRFANTAGSYQAQYSTDNGATFTNIGSAVAHNAFSRVGLNAFAAIANPTVSYAGAFEWFESTLAAATYSQDAYIWDASANSLTPGAHLAVNNTPFTLTSTGQQFRLRLLLGITGQSDAGNSPPQFKLQFIGKGTGTCAAPSGGTPSTYTDVDASTAIAYYDNTGGGVTDEANISTTASDDPTPSTGSKVAETYQEANNFSATQADLNNTNRGLWDFSLVDLAGGSSVTYCFKVVTSGGSDITTYTARPEITTAFIPGPTTDQVLRGGTWFSSGTKQPFFWAQ